MGHMVSTLSRNAVSVLEMPGLGKHATLPDHHWIIGIFLRSVIEETIELG